MVKYNYFYFIFFCLLGLTNYAQKVSNISYRQEQSNIIVSYDLETKIPTKIDLYVSTNGGASWQGPLKKVIGDVGVKMASGSHSISWNVLEEFEELSGNNIKFQVRAEESKTQSIASINKAIIKNPKDAKLFKLRGDLKYELEDTDGAIADYTKAISLNPKYADAYKARGILMFYDFKSAISDYSKAISLNPNDASAFFYRGYNKYSSEDYEGAISDYNKAIKIEPKNIEYIYRRANAKANSNNYTEAIEDINRVIELDSTFSMKGRLPIDMHYTRGIYKYSNKDFEGFDKDINHYVKYSTNPSKALSNIAEWFIREKEYSTAIDYYTKSIHLLPEKLVDSLEQRVVYLGRAFSSYMQKDESGTSYDFNNYIEKSQNKAEANFNIAEVFLNDGLYSSSDALHFFLDIKNLNKAIYYFTKSIELDPNNSSYYIRRASAKEELKDYSGAIADYSKAIELGPDAYSYSKRASAKVELEDYSGAIADYSKTIELEPDAYYYTLRASAKFNLKDYRGAIEDYSKAILLEPKTDYYYFDRGNANYNIGDYKGAIADYTKVILLNPKNGEAYLSRGDSKIAIKDKAGACKDFSKAGELGEEKAYEAINENCNK
jgi:tetratricopeptide (TPR) repeat protein